MCADDAEQPHHAPFAGRVPRVRYSCPKLQARFPAAWLDRPLSFADPIDDIATELGYADTPSFTRAVQRLTGEPPSSFRRRVRQ